MSYDVSIGDKSFNYTSNVSKLWYDHIPDYGQGGGLRELHGLTGKAALAILGEGFERLGDVRRSAPTDEAAFGGYSASNGWGSAYGAIIYMGRIMAACAANPRKKVRVCA